MKRSDPKKPRPRPKNQRRESLLFAVTAGQAGRKLLAAAAAGGLILAGAGVARADVIYNTLDVTVDSVAEVMPLNAGGAAGTTTLALSPTNGDGKSGCNLPGDTILTPQPGLKQPCGGHR